MSNFYIRLDDLEEVINEMQNEASAKFLIDLECYQ